MKNNYYSSKKILNSKISFGFFTIKDRYSKKKNSSLNYSMNSGDKQKVVAKNIKSALQCLRLDKKNLKMINQIHSNKIIIIDKKNLNKNFKGDGMITQCKDISLAILTADCCPIFLFDENSSFITSLHAGWKGCYNNIIKKAVKEIIKIQPKLKKVYAVIGPCLNYINFEVKKEFKNKFIKKSKNYKDFFYEEEETKRILFDMRKLIKYQLLNCNIINIEDINLDTYSNNKLFFSHRRSTHNKELPTGRMINVIGFNN